MLYKRLYLDWFHMDIWCLFKMQLFVLIHSSSVTVLFWSGLRCAGRQDAPMHEIHASSVAGSINQLKI